MDITELDIADAYVMTPAQHRDSRGMFAEWYRFEGLQERQGHRLEVKQANLSVSARGVVRGIHFAMVPPGQAKYVSVMTGAVLDFVVDLRIGSPTFGRWDSVRLDDVDRKAVYLANGLGHAFVALEESTAVCYLASEVFNADRELAVNPLDPDIALTMPAGLELVISDRDRQAPGLAELRAAGVLPKWDPARAAQL